MKISNFKFQIIKHSIIFLFASLTLHFALCTLHLETAEAVSLGIYPPIIKIDALPPASITTPIIIQNLGDETVSLTPTIRFFTAKNTQDGQVEYLPHNETPGPDPLIRQKMQFTENDQAITTITLAPQQQKEISLHIGLPKEEPLSDYYFSIVFLTDNQAVSEGNISQAQVGIATNVLLSLGPDETPKGSIEEFSTGFFHEKGPVPFTVRVSNAGNRVITPKGSILITNMFGQKIGKIDLQPVYILKGTTRAIPNNNTTQKESIDNKIQQYPTALWPESFLLGPYAATLTLSLGDNQPAFTRTTYFVGAPLQAGIGFLLLAVILFTIKKRVQRKLRG